VQHLIGKGLQYVQIFDVFAHSAHDCAALRFSKGVNACYELRSSLPNLHLFRFLCYTRLCIYLLPIKSQRCADIALPSLNMLYIKINLKFKVGDVHERIVERAKKMYGPNPKKFLLDPTHRNSLCNRLSGFCAFRSH